MTQEKKKMTTTTKGQDMEQFCMQKVRAMLSLSFLLLMLCLGVNGAWGQSTDYSGTYFIANYGEYTNPTGSNYYMVPAADPHQTNYNDAYYSANYNIAKGDPEKPFITTYKTSRDNNSIWQIIATGDGYYYIKHWQTGKYLIYEPPYTGDNFRRKSVHLQTTASPGENAKVDITANGTGYNIRPISLETTYRFLNPASNNSDLYYGSGGNLNWNGLIGVWNESTNNSLWHLDKTVLPPSFTIDHDGKVTITSEAGTTIHYTTTGTDPTASDESSMPITVTDAMTAIKAIAVRTSDNKASNVVTLPLQTYTYYIVNRADNVAVKCEIKQAVGKTLDSYLDIPEAIQSPYLADETVTFYSSGQFDDENIMTKTPSADANIYVKYTTDHLSEKFLKLRGARVFNITESGKCIYDNSGTLASETTDYSTPVTTSNHLWNILGGDPYAVQIKNLDTSGSYLVFSTPPTLSVAATATTTFILMEESSASDAAYESVKLMAATGTNTPDYFLKEVRAYPISVSTTYHLIDRANKLIASIPSTSSELALPSDWVSPLVSRYYYRKDATLSGNTIGSSCDFTGATTITSPFDVGTDGHIYVTYDVSDAIDLDGRNSLDISGKENKTYMLRYLNGDSFYQENGGDDVMDGSDGKAAELRQAVYPYSNGDAALYVYGDKRWQEQLASGASTRSRWLWLIEPANSPATKNDLDPYHVYISSNQPQTNYKPADVVLNNYHSYFRTYQPDGYDKIVTGVTNDNPKTTGGAEGDPANNSMATEYMILGTLSNSRLVTLHPVPLDSNHDGTPESNERRTITSFEMYWKNNPTVNGDASHNPPIPTKLSTGNEVTTVGRNVTLTASQKTDIENKGWHVYEEWANSAPWVNNGDNPATTGKKYMKEEHVFQTINMGADFVFEAVNLEPQVILLDQHGWEIVRIPLYKNYKTASQTLNTAELSKYNSPMVADNGYHWYPTATKVPGYHKYTVSGDPSNNSSSLAFDPSGDTDYYVTYTVKSTYANSYIGAATAENTVPSAFLLKQGDSYATMAAANSTSVSTTTEPTSRDNISEKMQWYIKPNFNIDREMGYKYLGETGAQDGVQSKDDTEAGYMANGQNGFDPYNVQIQNKAYPQRFFTANTTDSKLDGGVWKATTTSAVTLQNMTTTNRQTATGYDQTTLNITNATFMVVNDGLGNMRLMPRFDHGKVMTSFTSLEAQSSESTATGANGVGTQSLLIQLLATPKEIHSPSEIDNMNGHYLLASDFSFDGFTTSLGTSSAPFTGVIDGQLNTLEGLRVPLVAYADDGAIIKNVILKDVEISQSGYVGAIACIATGTTRIYNCGILPTTAKHESTNRSTVSSTNDHCGSLVGYLDGKARVINCFSYANVSAPANNSKVAGGLVGYNNKETQQGNNETNYNNNVNTMVVNCMFYGDITQGHIKRPVYGGTTIANNGENKTNNYNYFCEEEASYATYDNISKYNNSWPVAIKYLTRYEVYRNILNSNRRLCTWWVNGKYNTAPTDNDVETVGIAKWVLDQSIAPYPILREWGKYPSVVNPDPDKRVDPSTKEWTDRAFSENWGKHTAPDTDGQILGSITVNINGGDHHSGSNSRTINITAMDKEYKDYCYGKIQLPYYNEIFGNPNGTTWSEKYGDNYGEYVVTGWEITSTNGSDADGHSFSADWQDGYNFADRKCTSKDLYETSGRVFAQGGYYYVPDGVTTITIKAHWGKAVYLCNKNSRLDMINNAGNEFYIAGALSFGVTGGMLPLWPSTNTLKTSLDDAIDGLSINPTGSVYDQAIVLVGNYQNNDIQGGSGNTSKLILSGDQYATKAKPFTIMSADFDLDNEPDFCFQVGMNNGGRPNIHPIRFDFLMVPDITMAIRKDANYLGMRIICPQGHFEVTETSYMYITQFEYDKRGTTTHNKHEAPLILNGGEFFQIVSKEQVDGISTNPSTLSTWECDRTSYFLLGGNLWMKAFTPGVHGNGRVSTRHCAVNAIGGEFPEFYLSGMFRTDFYNKTDNPHAYLDGGKFGLVAGAGMESVGGKNETNGGDVTFKINHSLIDEFYGGGINAQRPVTGNINVTIDNSKVKKYCGGPKLGDMSNTKTITTNATGSTFDEFYGGGNGGTNLLRERQYDAGAGVDAPSQSNHNHWDTTAKFTAFTPFSYTSGKGYQAEYEFEMLPRTSGNSKVITRSYYYWASFSKTTVAPVTNTITDCTFNGNFYGGGNLGAVDSPTSSTNPAISSTLSGHTVVHGSVFGAGFSASATSFKVHDKTSVVYPYRDNSGFIHDGSLDYEKISVEPLVYKEYTWINTIPTEWGKTASTSSPTFDYKGKYYCFTPVSMEGLGTVTGNVELTIKGNTIVEGKVFNEDGSVDDTKIGGVFGGGAQSAVTGNTTVNIEGNTHVLGNVFGGGDEGVVEGSAKVNIKSE